MDVQNLDHLAGVSIKHFVGMPEKGTTRTPGRSATSCALSGHRLMRETTDRRRI
jgi:hypothetical protein